VIAVLDRQPDRGAALALDLDVVERRHAHQVDAGWRDVPARDRDGLDRLVQRTGADHLDLDGPRLPHDPSHRPSDTVRVRPARDF